MRWPPEDEEFRRAVADVAPLRSSRRAAHANPRRPPIAAQRALDERAALRDALQGPVSVEVPNPMYWQLDLDSLVREAFESLGLYMPVKA